MNIEKFFPFVADNVFKARCIACVFATKMGLNFGSAAVMQILCGFQW